MDGTKKSVSVKVAAAALLFFLSLSIAHDLGQPVSVHPNQTEAAGTHYNYGTPFNVTLFANATTEERLWCNASITLLTTGINFTAYTGATNTTYIGNISNQSVANATWSLNATGRGAHNLSFSLTCNGSGPVPANTTIYVDLLNITLVNVTTPYSIRWNDSYLEVYRNASYNISVSVSTLDATQSLTNVIAYLNGTNSSAFSVNSSNPLQTSIFNASAANVPVNTIYEYTIATNDTQRDRWTQPPLVIRVISPLNVSLSFNDSAIVANQSFTATATAANKGPLNLTSINLTFTQADGGLNQTNATCQLFSLVQAGTNNSCVWAFNSTTQAAKANITIAGTSLEGDNNTYPFSARIYGWGSFTANASISFGTRNHTEGTVTQSVILNATATEDLVNFNCTAAGELNATCQTLLSLAKSNTSTYNISLAIPPYTSKGIHAGNVSIYAENANPFVVNYSVNVTGIKKCSLTSPVPAARATGASTTGFGSVNLTNLGNVNITAVSCGSSGCNQIQSPSNPLTPGNSAIYNLSATTAALSSTSTTFLVNCTSSDTDAIDGGTSNNLTITYPSGESSGTTTTTTTQTQQQTPANTSTYAYTVALTPATAAVKKGESSEFTIAVKNTGLLTLYNLTVSGDATLQFSVTPTKIASITTGNTGTSKITVTASSSNTAGTYKLKAKVCRATTSCVTSSESTITIPEDTPPPANTTQNQTNATANATAAPAPKNATLNVTAEDNSLKLLLGNTTNATAYVEVVDSAGKVVYNLTGPVNGTEYNITLPETLKAGNYTLRIAVKDFSGNTIAQKNLTYTAKAQEQKTETKASYLKMPSPGIINALLVIIMALFIMAGIKTSKIGGTIKSTLNIRQKILDKAQAAYQQGEYGKAREYRTAAESASSTERELMRKIGDSEKRIVQLYREGRHLQARKEQESLSRMRKELEILREQHGK